MKSVQRGKGFDRARDRPAERVEGQVQIVQRGEAANRVWDRSAAESRPQIQVVAARRTRNAVQPILMFLEERFCWRGSRGDRRTRRRPRPRDIGFRRAQPDDS